ncbi:hypothetical protein QFC19_005781 [Naganishia cerealis]|uniref:Uncharacterized protein n=1 Tax=Naganishia cerealis TaxID=610337 RepID=A0ACC2VLV3_9TREE|nr:hypothetical protein QFC19_005781 [Naganishia cerealis]
MSSGHTLENGARSSFTPMVVDTAEDSGAYEELVMLPSGPTNVRPPTTVSGRLSIGNLASAFPTSSVTNESLGQSSVYSSSSALPGASNAAPTKTPGTDKSNTMKVIRPKTILVQQQNNETHPNGVSQVISPAPLSSRSMEVDQGGRTSGSTPECVNPELVPLFKYRTTGAKSNSAASPADSTLVSGANHLSCPSSSHGSRSVSPNPLEDLVAMLRKNLAAAGNTGTSTLVHSGPSRLARTTNAEDVDDDDAIEILDEMPKSSRPLSRPLSRSPSFELLTEEAFQRTTTPNKKRRFGPMPPPDETRTANKNKNIFAEPAAVPAVTATAAATSTKVITPDLPDREEALLEEIGGVSEVEVSVDDFAQILEDEFVVGTSTDEPKQPINQLQQNAPSVQHARPVQNAVPVQNARPPVSTSSSTSKSTSITKPARPTVFFKVPTAANIMANNSTPTVSAGESSPFLVNAPYSKSAKGKEPVRSAVPFERKASPPIAQITTLERQELWMKQAVTPQDSSQPMDIDTLLHAEDPEDDPFTATASDQNAVAGPSFAYPESSEPEKARTFLLPESMGSFGMSKDFDYRRFNEPLLDCINSLPPHAQNGSHIRVVLEAYYSQSSTDRAPPIKIDGGDRDEFPPAEFKYSDEVYYSDRVPKPWLGKGCQCVGPCSENSECFCLKRQEMYFASYVTDPSVGPLKGFAYNADGTLKDCQYPTWECGPQCECPPACKNRVMQKGRSSNVKLQIYKTRKKGWGKSTCVRALSSFPKGTFVGLYSGELIPEDETDSRGEIYNAIERTYLFDLDHWHIKQPPENLHSIDPAGAYIAQQAAALLTAEDEKDQLAEEQGREVTTFNSFFTVDAFHWGNHSCDPNLVLSAAYFDDFDIRKPRYRDFPVCNHLLCLPNLCVYRLAITAKRDVRKGDELCISYSGPPDSDEQPPMMETDEQLNARTGGKDNGKRGVVKKRKGGTAHKQKAAKTPEKMEKGRCQCGAKNCMGYMFNAYSGA